MTFYRVFDGKISASELKFKYVKGPPFSTWFEQDNRLITTPKLSGEGRKVLSYMSGDTISDDPLVQQFDSSKFDITTMTIEKALAFSDKLFPFANKNVPVISSDHDCILLSYRKEVRWLIK